MPDTVIEPELSVMSRQERVALLERVAGSQHFRRATRLRDFLLFVGRHSIESDAVTIHEQEVGTTVFGRAEGYDTSLDNIVRVNATELRKRLELYFGTEGADEPLVLEIPRGSYSAVFRQRAVTVGAPVVETETNDTVPVAGPVVETIAVPEKPAEVEPRERPTRWRGYVPWVAAALLLVACVSLYWRNTRLESMLSPWKSDAALKMLWSQFFEPGAPVDLVVADTSFGLAEDIAGKDISLSDYLNYEYKNLLQDPAISPDHRTDLAMVLGRTNGSIGDFIVAQRILALDPAGSAMQLKFAREYSPEAIKTNSVILIGSQETNPWVELFSDRLNFSMEYDAARHLPFVKNRHPKPGEQETYLRASNPARSEGYSVIAFVPDLSRNGSALIIAGTDSQATRSAGEFVTNGASLESLRNRLGATGRFPYFEVLLHDLQIKGTPLRSEILAFRNEGEAGLPVDGSRGPGH